MLKKTVGLECVIAQNSMSPNLPAIVLESSERVEKGMLTFSLLGFIRISPYADHKCSSRLHLEKMFV